MCAVPVTVGTAEECDAAHRAYAARIAALEATVATLLTPPETGPDVTAVVRVNCGGGAWTDPAGNAWDADPGSGGGTSSAQGVGAYDGPDAALHETERWGSAFGYALAGLPPGDATVRLYFAESYPPASAPGARVFDVHVEGAAVLTGYDIVAKAGGQYRPVTEVVHTSVSADGVLDIRFTGVVGAAKVDAVEVLCYGTSLPPDPVPPGADRVTWRSGGSDRTGVLAELDAWGAARGRRCDAANFFPTRDGWGSLLSWTGQPAVYTAAAKDVLLSIQVPPFPEGETTYAHAEAGRDGPGGAPGSYEARWAGYGRVLAPLVAEGRVICVNLGWEPNGDYMYWGHGGGQGYTSPGQFVRTFRRAVTGLRSTCPGVLIGWIMNGGSTPAAIGPDSTVLYPGDEYVDVIGTDYYDHYPHTPDIAAFDRKSRAPGGLRWYADMAVRHGKRFAMPEFGIAPGSVGGNPGYPAGDNPSFVTGVWTVCREYAATLLYECYFSDAVGGGNVDSDLFGGANPLATARYAQLWGTP